MTEAKSEGGIWFTVETGEQIERALALIEQEPIRYRMIGNVFLLKDENRQEGPLEHWVLTGEEGVRCQWRRCWNQATHSYGQGERHFPICSAHWPKIITFVVDTQLILGGVMGMTQEQYEQEVWAVTE